MDDILGVIGLIGWAGSIILLFIVLSTLYKEKGGGSAFFGFIIPLYTFFWGWLNLEMLRGSYPHHKTHMLIWTFLIALIFIPALIFS